jgi:hypothetical protein
VDLKGYIMVCVCLRGFNRTQENEAILWKNYYLKLYIFICKKKI